MIDFFTRPAAAGSVCIKGFLAAAFAVTSAGCTGGSDAPDLPLSPATGTVKIDDEPADGVAMTFIPDNQTQGQGGWAVTDASGKFVALQYAGEDGVAAEGLPAGNYIVTFSRLRMPDGSPIPEGKDAADVGAVESLPKHLSSPNMEAPPYQYTVPPNGEITFELKSVGGRRR